MSDLDTLSRLAAQVQERCHAATGKTLEGPGFDSLTAKAATEAEFRSVVTALYKWLHERWQPHIRFLGEASRRIGSPGRLLEDFRKDVQCIRQVQQHNDADEWKKRRAAEWFRNACGSDTPSTDDQWASCGAQIVDQCDSAMRQAVGVVRAVEQHPAEVEIWVSVFTSIEGFDAKASVSIIAQDLGLNLREGEVNHISRQADGRWRRLSQSLTSADDRETIFLAMVAREIVAWSLGELPVTHDMILDRLELDAGSSALAALRLAYAVNISTAYDSTDEFLDLVARAWSDLST